MRPRRAALLSLATLVFAACQDQPDPTGPPHSAISDAAHGGNAHFYFLPPLVPAPTYTGTFDGTRSPVVDICQWDGTVCGTSIATFTMTTGMGSETVRVVDDHYIVNWHTDEFPLITQQMYRITVSVDGTDLGYADVVIAESGREAKSMTTGETFGLKDGRTLPIKFRIEEGYDPIGELTPQERAKISPVLQTYVIEHDVFDPFKTIVTLDEVHDALDQQAGFLVLKEFGPTLPYAVVQIISSEGMALLARDPTVNLISENKRYDPLATPSQVLIGQPFAQLNGHVGDGTSVGVLDTGIDLTDPAFVGSEVVDLEMDVGDSCEDPWHGTIVARQVVQAAPGAVLIMLDVEDYSCTLGGSCGCAMWSDGFLTAAQWIFDHQDEYNIVAMNMSYAAGGGSYPTEDCPMLPAEEGTLENLRNRGIMPFAGSGNDNLVDGVSAPACTPAVTSVAAVDPSTDEIWYEFSTKGSTRGPNLDLLAPGCEGSRCGTSLAAPIAAGAWAVMRAALPDLSLEETLGLLKTTGVPVYDPETELTFPRIQLDAALGLLDSKLTLPIDVSGAFGGEDENDFYALTLDQPTLVRITLEWDIVEQNLDVFVLDAALDAECESAGATTAKPEIFSCALVAGDHLLSVNNFSAAQGAPVPVNYQLTVVPVAMAEIQGTVTVGGNPTLGVQVSLDETGLGTMSNADGLYRLVNVAPGTYTVRAILAGFGVRTEIVTVGEGEVKTVNFAF